MQKLRYNAAGIDIGAKKIFIGIEGQPVRNFSTFTADFRLVIDYLLSHKIETVAMEATGVYWVILYDMLEAAGFDVWLVDGRQTRQVPGRKTDVKDCQWIQQLHSYGLLNRCFIPDAHIQELRTYQRLREDHIRSASMHVNHMQKALTLMNIRLKEVMSQIHGTSGLAMIRSILDGQRDAKKLLLLCDVRLRKNKGDQILKALEGHYKEASLFELRQAYESYEFYQTRIGECDERIEQVLNKINATKDSSSKKKLANVKPSAITSPK